MLALAAAGRAGTVTDNFDTPQNYLADLSGTIWDGLKVTGGGGSIAACDTTSNPGSLNFASTNTQGHTDHAILYKTLPADTDFEATVKMVNGNWVPYPNYADPSSTNPGFVAWHSCGLTAARDADEWVANFYFSHPEWSATFIGRSIVPPGDKNPDDKNEAAGGANIDTYPYTKLARVGNDFFWYYSPDGVNWTPFWQVTRNDLAGVPLEVGLRHAMYSGNTASAILDDFTLSGRGIGEPTDIPEPVTLGALSLALAGLGGYVRRRRKLG
ncbi:MAG: hypothetical protein AMS14_04255 [Planctomycetes bacterium DG_20]|nr:MAG: hypothetical protein AMS14_04255 [Planctomycetes bacterium DG_20]